MIEFPFIVVAGLLGSAHCIGMCGGFVISLGLHSANRRHNVARQLSFSTGRVVTYGVLGALAGFCGMRIERWSWSMNQVVSVLALVAGLFLIAQGLVSVGWVRWPSMRRAPAACLAASIFSTFQRGSRLSDAFHLGLLTGFLPCGLLYGLLALAANTRDFLTGALVMICFGLGTIPALLLTGCGAHLLTGFWRKRLYQLAGWCLIVTGIITVSRGMDLQSFVLRTSTTADCPFCAPE